MKRGETNHLISELFGKLNIKMSVSDLAPGGRFFRISAVRTDFPFASVLRPVHPAGGQGPRMSSRPIPPGPEGSNGPRSRPVAVPWPSYPPRPRTCGFRATFLRNKPAPAAFPPAHEDIPRPHCAPRVRPGRPRRRQTAPRHSRQGHLRKQARLRPRRPVEGREGQVGTRQRCPARLRKARGQARRRHPPAEQARRFRHRI